MATSTASYRVTVSVLCLLRETFPTAETIFDLGAHGRVADQLLRFCNGL
jgi:hypothetical protein